MIDSVEMGTTEIQIRVDQDLKDQAAAVFEDVGIDMPTAVHMFFMAAVRERSIPFSTALKEQEKERRKASLVGTGFILANSRMGREMQRKLTEEGFTVYMSNPKRQECRLWLADYLPPATRNSDGFFIENNALANRIRRELRQEPYNRTDGSFLPLLLTDDQRNGSEDVIGFVPGRRMESGYRPGYRYISSNVFLYTNFEACIHAAIPEFDIYGIGYTVSWKEWETIIQTAEKYSQYATAVARELDDWLRRELSENNNPAMSIMCI